MNSYEFFIYEFICFMNSYMNSGVSRFQMVTQARPASWTRSLSVSSVSDRRRHGASASFADSDLSGFKIYSLAGNVGPGPRQPRGTGCKLCRGGSCNTSGLGYFIQVSRRLHVSNRETTPSESPSPRPNWQVQLEYHDIQA